MLETQSQQIWQQTPPHDGTAGHGDRLRLTVGQPHESTQAVALLKETITRTWPNVVAGEMAYSTIGFRNGLTAHEIESVILHQDNESGPKPPDRDAYQERPFVERSINRSNRYRRVATRYEKRAAYLATFTVACIFERL